MTSPVPPPGVPGPDHVELDLMDHVLIGKARKLAESAHADQVDKSGAPYVEHLARVADRVGGGVAKAVAWLHDTVEDTDVSEPDLAATGMPQEVIDAVLAITHRRNEPRADYYARVKTNPYALQVKLADVTDNSDPARLAVLDEATRARLERKYAQAREALEDR